jgi:hypothetical protein
MTVGSGATSRDPYRASRDRSATATASSGADASAQGLDQYLRMLAGPAPGARLVEIRFALRHGDMGRLFIAAHSALGASRLIRRLADRTDVYVGVCLRSRRAGGRDAIDRAHLAFVEIDEPDAVERLRAFYAAPTMIVFSGGPGHAHAYFALSAPISVMELERANRRLAGALGGDLASVDAARILRPVGSRNHKYTPAIAVEMVEYAPCRRYDVDELVGGLADPSPPTAPGSFTGRTTIRTETDRLLLAISATEYVRVLTGLTPNRSGKISCPFHDDQVPSLQLYDDGTWYCFGACRAGGSVFDFGARRLGLGTTGRDFLRLRQRLVEALLAPGVAHEQGGAA